MTLLGLSTEPWMVRAVIVCGIASLVVGILAWMASRRARDERAEYERWQRGGR